MHLLYCPVCMYDSLTYFHPSSNKHRLVNMHLKKLYSITESMHKGKEEREAGPE
jgi:uncharacterized protein YbaR (Trm112 family)